MTRRPRSSPPPAAPAPPKRQPLPALVLAVKYAVFSGAIRPASAPVQPPAAREAEPATPAPPAAKNAAVGQPQPTVAAPATPTPPVPPARPAPADSQMYCQRRSLWCSRDFCDSEYKRSQTPKPDPWTARWHCYRCPDWAARHAPPAPGESPPPAWESRCVRCMELTNRLILGTLCPSCYNRGRETVIGVNSRGRPVQFLPRLARYRIAAIYPPAERITWVEVTAAHWIEAMRVVVAIAARAGCRVWILPAMSERIGRPTTIMPTLTPGPAIVSSELPPSAHRAPLVPLAVSAVGTTASAASPQQRGHAHDPIRPRPSRASRPNL